MTNDLHDDPAVAAATPVPDRTRHATFVRRLARRAGDAPVALCAGIDPSPAACELLVHVPAPPSRPPRMARASRIERFAGLVIESVRDHAAAVKPQIAWYEACGAPGFRALERTIEFARTAGLLVILDAKRGDVPHTAAAYADAWLGDDASSGMGVDALTVNASCGVDSLDAMADVAYQRNCALYALVHTSNPGATSLQQAKLASGDVWWQQLARTLNEVDAGRGVVGAVVGATHHDVLATARDLLPQAPLLVPGIGAQGAGVADVASLASSTAPTSLVVAARSLLPDSQLDTQPFRNAVDTRARALATDLSALARRSTAVR